jgi:hypothetical protein
MLLIIIQMDTPSNDGPFSELNNMRTTNLTQLGDVRTAGNNIGFGKGVLAGIDSSTTTNAIAIGENVSADADTGAKSISLGSAFGAPFDQSTSQNGIGVGSIAIGTSANGNGGANLGNLSVMVGGGCSYLGCGDGVVAIGQAAGAGAAPNDHAVCIGTNAGSAGAGANSVCVGFQSGASGSGQDSLLLGHAADGTTNSSIVLNATGTTLSSIQDSLVIKPIVNNGTVHATGGAVKTPNPVNGFTHILYYAPSTGEIRAFAYA